LSCILKHQANSQHRNPAVTILLAHFLLKERLAQTQKVGVAAILIGLALIALI
jgi:drug/metabolite transporter (DMT)-like permease